MIAIRRLRKVLSDHSEQREDSSQNKLRKLKHLDNTITGSSRLSEAVVSLEEGDAATLLHSYAAAGHDTLLRVLLEHKACDVDVRRPKDGCTALHIAKYRKNERASQLLLSFGADLMARNTWGETPAEASDAADLP